MDLAGTNREVAVLQGDNTADIISVSVSQNDYAFTLDGQSYADVSYIFVHGGGGDDQISVISLDGAGMIGASISGEEGNDTITLNFDGAVWAGSGNDIGRAFCGTCGSPLWSATTDGTPFLPVKAGALDDPSDLKPTSEVYTCEAQPWHLRHGGVRSFEKMPAQR